MASERAYVLVTTAIHRSKRDELKAAADAEGLALSAYIRRLIYADLRARSRTAAPA